MGKVSARSARYGERALPDGSWEEIFVANFVANFVVNLIGRIRIGWAADKVCEEVLGGTSAATWWGGWTLATAIPFCEQVSARGESRRTSQSRRGPPPRTGRDRSSLSPGERVGLRANRKRLLPPAVAAESPKSIELPARSGALRRGGLREICLSLRASASPREALRFMAPLSARPARYGERTPPYG